MRFELLRERVARAERRVAVCSDRAERTRGEFREAWRLGWSPTRIVVAGFLSGFLIGRAEPVSKVGGARWLQMLGTISSMVASLRAASTSEEASASADAAAVQAASANQNVAEATGQAPPVPVDPAAAQAGTAAPDAAAMARAPSPAEAATEISER
jgi:hypothetical protein